GGDRLLCRLLLPDLRAGHQATPGADRVRRRLDARSEVRADGHCHAVPWRRRDARRLHRRLPLLRRRGTAARGARRSGKRQHADGPRRDGVLPAGRGEGRERPGGAFSRPSSEGRSIQVGFLLSLARVQTGPRALRRPRPRASVTSSVARSPRPWTPRSSWSNACCLRWSTFTPKWLRPTLPQRSSATNAWARARSSGATVSSSP